MKKLLLLPLMAFGLLHIAKAQMNIESNDKPREEFVVIKDPVLKVFRKGGKVYQDGSMGYGCVSALISSDEWTIECKGRGWEKCQFVLPSGDARMQEHHRVMQAAVDVSNEIFTSYQQQSKGMLATRMELSVQNEVFRRVYHAELTVIGKDTVAIVVTIEPMR
jgi:hypothetical protein